MSLTVNHLTKTFGSQSAVKDVSFTAHPGEILGFLGPNGAGKSTTMKMITGYYEPTAGNVNVCGHEVTEDLINVQKSIGYLPENNPLYLDMYVKEYLTFVANIHRLKNKNNRIKEVIKLTGLDKEQHKIIGTLSKGYRQRLGLAQALIHDPQVLILDEPTSGLDMNQLVEIRKLIKELGKTKTIVFSTHIMQEVQALCDRVIIINEGKIVANDKIENLKFNNDKIQKIVVKFEGQIMSMDKIKSIKGVLDVVGEGNEYIVAVNAESEIRPALFHLAVEENWVIIEMKMEENNMENVFQEITKN